MNDVIKLQKGHSYFYAMFYDPGLSVPKIETVVYVGRDDDGSHLFQDAESYLAHERGEKNHEGYLTSFPDGRIYSILDKAHLIEWLQEEHSPKLVGRSYEYEVVD